jgi:hypothetical protein
VEQQLELSEAFLLRIVLSWYANPANWAASGGQGPYSSTRSSSASIDSGRAAARAAMAQGVGPLILLVMDLLNQPMNELARVSGLDIPRLSLIVQGLEPTREESIQLRLGISVLTHLFGRMERV